MSLTLETILRSVYPEFDPAHTKLHLAQSNGIDHPLDVFDAGHFKAWQDGQNNANFNRPYVTALIETRSKNIWMFAGLWRVNGAPVTGPDPHNSLVGRLPENVLVYDTTAVPEVTDLVGRLNIQYEKVARQPYRLFETLSGKLRVSSLVDAPRQVPRFRGYRDVRPRWSVLRQVIRTSPEDWRTALSSVGGVYLIVTGDGRLYVGSASGVEGFWGRWNAYVASGGHGGNEAMRTAVGEEPQLSESFQFSILETADTATSTEDILARESHWKRVLGTRATGLNLN